MPLHKLSESELRNYCKHYLETLERWLRRLVDDELRQNYGNEYYKFQDKHGNYIINKAIQEKIAKRLESEPDRYQKWINATLLDELITIISHPQLYFHFKPALQEAFPQGNYEARTFLERLIQPRNHLSHVNPISVRQAEQVICYVNDIIDSIKQYYNEKNMGKEFNVPSFIRIWDSFGNQREVTKTKEIFSFDENPKNYLYPGDKLSIGVEIDSSFSSSEYDLEWGYGLANRITANLQNMTFLIEEKHVGEIFRIICWITSKKNWHRFQRYDDKVEFWYKVLPPLE